MKDLTKLTEIHVHTKVEIKCKVRELKWFAEDLKKKYQESEKIQAGNKARKIIKECQTINTQAEDETVETKNNYTQTAGDVNLSRI